MVAEAVVVLAVELVASAAAAVVLAAVALPVLVELVAVAEAARREMALPVALV